MMWIYIIIALLATSQCSKIYKKNTIHYSSPLFLELPPAAVGVPSLPPPSPMLKNFKGNDFRYSLEEEDYDLQTALFMIQFRKMCANHNLYKKLINPEISIVDKVQTIQSLRSLHPKHPFRDIIDTTAQWGAAVTKDDPF